MKKCYFIILLFFALFSYGQETNSLSNGSSTKESNFKLHPNPAIDDVVYITTSTNGKKDVIAYDVFGEVVLSERISSKALNISRLVAGVYVLQVTENGKTMTRKLVVK